ncbi:MAG TPA: hydroxymethylbilane synthase [Solirubrobacteraceae bacterium]|nr:hydroxymethylbilane synthase [Solirubrobacteraceae bacterium]
MRIGTRGSALALVQAESVAARLRAAGHQADLIKVRTAGDRGERAADKSRWVQELEQALHDGRIDLAVHSAKDVPTEVPEEFRLIAVPGREDPRDALCGAGTLAELPSGSRVGTSSLRRRAQLRALRADLDVVELRGNVDTRLAKLEAGEVDAVVLALAGLIRLGRQAEAGCALDELVPAAGQGTLVVEAAHGSPHEETVENALHDLTTDACLRAERELMRHLGASCHTPVGAHARQVGASLRMRAWVGLPDGSEWIADELTEPPGDVAASLYERMRAMGAEELLRRAEAS